MEKNVMTVEKAIGILDGLAKCLPAAKADFDAIIELLKDKKNDGNLSNS